MPIEDANLPQQAAVPITISAQYVKDFSFESPNAPQIFLSLNKPPEVTMGVNLSTRVMTPPGNAPQASYEVLLALKLEAKIDAKTAFIGELVYGGIFNLPQMPEEQMRMFLLVEAPRIMFPFARSVLANAVREGGFPQIMINPIDFMGLYMANQKNVGTMATAGVA